MASMIHGSRLSKPRILGSRSTIDEEAEERTEAVRDLSEGSQVLEPDGQAEGEEMIQAGMLREVIVIQSPVEIQDSLGQLDIAYETLYEDVRAQIVPLSGREYITAKQVMADVTTRMMIRRIPNVTPNCRIVRTITTDDPVTVEVYDVLAVLPDAESGQQYLTLMCVQRIAEGFRRGE